MSSVFDSPPQTKSQVSIHIRHRYCKILPRLAHHPAHEAESLTMGSLRERPPGSGHWELRVYGGGTRTFHGKRRDAEKALARFVTETDEGRAVAARGRTVATLANAWFKARAPVWSPATADGTRRFLDRVFLPELGAMPLSRVRTEHIDAFYSARRRAGATETTIRRHHSVISPMFNQGIRWGWIGVNPATNTYRPPVAGKQVRPPDPAVVVGLMRHVARRDETMADFLILAADTGARLGQLCALRWDDFDADAGTLRIVRTLTITGDIRPLSKTKGRARVVPLGVSTVRTLSVHRMAMRERALTFGTKLPKLAFMFSDDPACRTPWKVNTFEKRYVRLRREPGAGPGAADVNFHQLRHYVATQLIAAGVDVRTVADRLGHARTSTTLDMYAAPVSEMGRTAADLLERILDEARYKTS